MTWDDVICNLGEVPAVRVGMDGQRYWLRNPVGGCTGVVFRAVGVWLPPVAEPLWPLTTLAEATSLMLNEVRRCWSQSLDAEKQWYRIRNSPLTQIRASIELHHASVPIRPILCHQKLGMCLARASPSASLATNQRDRIF
jgi:hypothetical protein